MGDRLLLLSAAAASAPINPRSHGLASNLGSAFPPRRKAKPGSSGEPLQLVVPTRADGIQLFLVTSG